MTTHPSNPAPPIALFRRFPELEPRFPRVPLCDLPTPVERFGIDLPNAAAIYIKRDDLTARPYGGNKVRKLEFLLGHAKKIGAREIVTFGYAGSNHALATAIYARRAGLRVTSMLLPQPNAAYVRRNLLASHAAGARLVARSSVNAIATTVTLKTLTSLLRYGRRPFIVPAGGSSTIGVMGYVNAALELADQIEAGLLPKPDRIYLAMGSMGTTAGLAVGLALAGIDAELHAVRVVDERFASGPRLRRLIDATLQSIAPVAPAHDPMTRVRVRDEFFGERYGEFTQAGIDAVEAARDSAGIRLDGTYSGKALSALIADAGRAECTSKTVLFWNTHNAQDVHALGSNTDYRDLPRSFHQYFEEPLQPLESDVKGC